MPYLYIIYLNDAKKRLPAWLLEEDSIPSGYGLHGCLIYGGNTQKHPLLIHIYSWLACSRIKMF